MSSIFVQVPAYRDFELPKTIENMYNKASGRHTVNFGVHNCVMFHGEVSVDASWPYGEVRVVESIAPSNIGLQLARKLANEQYNGEDYYLQIDSHMRLVRDWDEKLIANIDFYRSLGINKPLLTMYPATYTYNDDGTERYAPPEDDLPPYRPSVISFHENQKQFADTLLPSQMAVGCAPECVYTASTSGGFIFTLGEFHRLTPNPKIAFWGEEPLIAARAFTSGFDLVVPLQDTAWHLYHSGQKFNKVRRHHVWTDFRVEWSRFDRESRQEYTRIMSQAVVGPYELGEVRTLDEYGEFAGLDFKNRVVTRTTLIELCRD